jgi:hypothetical protein
MAMQTERLDESGDVTVLAKVLSSTSYGKSIYVNVPRIGRDRRTDGGAKDMGRGRVEFAGDIEDYKRGEYVHLHFRPNKYSDEKHTLDRVEKAQFTDPVNSDEPKFHNTDIPKTCPVCSRKAAAVVKTEYDSMNGGKVADDADSCVVDPDNRGAWLDLSREHTFIHGVEE